MPLKRRTVMTGLAALALMLVAEGTQAESISSTGSGLWTDPASWNPTQVPTSADDVTILTGHTNTISTNVAISIASLTIQTNGVLTHLANSTTNLGERYKVVLNITGNLTIDLGGQINADSKGYNADGPGYVDYYKGSSHGGKGSGLGPTYGSITAPTNLGSGSRDAPECGGGAVLLSVTGTSTVNGVISASDMGGNGYGSSGGSVFLTTGTLTGNGTLRANGRIFGGGGRIAVILTNSTDFGAVKMQAYGGPSGGAGGTVYLQNTNHTPDQGKLIVDYNDIIPADPLAINTLQSGLGASSHEFSEIVLTNGAVYALDTNDTLIITNTAIYSDPVDRNDGIYVNGGTLTIPAAFGFTNYYIAVGRTNATFLPTASLTVGTNATMKFDVPWTVNYPITLEAGGWLSHSPNSTDLLGERYKLNLTLNAGLNIQAGGQVNVDNMGYFYSGPGYVDYYKGSSYGGQGTGKGSTYGSITAPTNLGSGSLEAPERGGGSARLIVAGTTMVNGAISASDMGGNSYGSSGGSVFLTTGVLTGSGTIRANGRQGSGGGRIAVILTNSTDFGSIRMQAYGGPSGGAAGTIYTETPSQGPGKGILLIDASNIVSTVFTLIGSQVTDTVVGTVVITNKAVLAVSNQTLTVQGDWDSKATVTGMVNGAVVFAGTNTATIKGNSTYYNLFCTNAGKALAFEDGKTNTVNGILTLANVTLDSMSGSTSWYLKAAVNMHSVSNVTVSRSDARPGVPIEAYGSTDQGGNYNWVFAESGFRTNTWTGTTDSDWSKTNNWSRGRPTIFTDTVIVPGSCTNYPFLDADKRLLALAISNGASMSLNGFNLTVDGNTRVAGMLIATGAVKLTLGGDLDFSGGGAFNAASSTVWMVGSNAQTVVSAGNAFYNLTISNSAAPVVFADAVLASNIVNVGTPIAFGGDVTVASAFRTQGTNVTFGGAVTATTFQNANGPLVFSGALTAQAFNNANGALVFSGAVATVTFTNWQGDLTFWDNVSTRDFYCAPGAMALMFNTGKTYTVGNLELYGRVGYPIQLRSSAGSYWYLNVTNRATVRLVDVQYSDASGGQKIRALASTDSGDNPNWEFDGPWQTWAGTNSAIFTNANNWVPAGAPDTTARVLIDGYYSNAPVLSGTATVAQLMVGGGVTTATLTVNGQLTTLGDVQVLSRGTITHSANAGSETYKLQLTVGSNLTIFAGGQINVDNIGYGTAGPGYVGYYAAASHGGKGTGGGSTYGSITAPTNLGCGTWAANGGGAARLMVAGTTTVNGVISASDMGVYIYGCSGGSVFLTTGTLAGNGTLRANSYAGGGGGRVAILLTRPGAGWDGFAGVMSAYGGSGNAGAGTVYRETADEGTGKGTVWINNSGLAGSGVCVLPPQLLSVSNEIKSAQLVITNTSRALLSTNLWVKDILIATNSYLTLSNSFLHVNSCKHWLGDASRRGDGHTNRVDHYDQILWEGQNPGMVFSIH